MRSKDFVPDIQAPSRSKFRVYYFACVYNFETEKKRGARARYSRLGRPFRREKLPFCRGK
jgi:predicted solute-binding protein